MRRSHHALQFNVQLSVCENCGALKKLHHLCDACGFYRGRKVLDIPEDWSGEDSEESEESSVEE
jgi:large subunit ribosomal protein L32